MSVYLFFHKKLIFYFVSLFQNKRIEMFKLFSNKSKVVIPVTDSDTPKPKLKPTMNSDQYMTLCDSLESTANVLEKLMENPDELIKKDKILYEDLVYNVYKRLFNYFDKDVRPSFDDIDAMLLVCRILLKHKKKDMFSEFILACPEKFLITYVNNSETSPFIFRELITQGLGHICEYLMPYIHESKKSIWQQRSA